MNSLTSNLTSPSGALLIAFIALCAAVMLLSISLGIADRYAFEANHQAEAWQAQESPKSRERLDTAIEKMQRAVRLAPTNPDYLDTLARLLMFSYVLDRDPAVLASARGHLHASLSIRPKGPGNWAVLVELKHIAGEIDPEFSEAIIRATEHGPWEPNVLQAVTLGGVANYALLTQEAQHAVITNIGRGLRSPLNGMANRIATRTLSEADGWTLGFTQRLTQLLISEDWPQIARNAQVRLTLALWPLLDSGQRDLLAVKVVEAIVAKPDNKLLRQARSVGMLPRLCPRLPRTRTFQRICKGAL